MGPRLRGSEQLDPLLVPLPNGTEVATRVERLRAADDDARAIPAGAVGRVIGERDGVYEVRLVSGEHASFVRSELLPRKAGQLRFAMRRATDWQTLSACRVLEATVGSRAWGLAHEGSDHDVRGAFVLPFAWQGGLAELPYDLISADGSATFWEIGKLVRQAVRADPNTLELLFVEGARPLDVMGEWLLAARDAFVSRQIYGTFGRYALSQLKKLQQASRLAEHRALILAWLAADPTLTLDAVAAELARATSIEAPSARDAEQLAKEYVKQLYRSLYDQALLPQNDFASLARFAVMQQATPNEAPDGSPFVLPRELRPKNAYNLLRLIGTAIDWLRTGTASLRVAGARRDELLAIKRGEVPLADVLLRAEALMPELEDAHRQSVLPEQPDLARADSLLRRIHHETARRWVAQAPGPFGADAPPLPTQEQP